MNQKGFAPIILILISVIATLFLGTFYFWHPFFSSTNTPIEMSPFSVCDLNKDAKVDEKDLQKIQSFIGKCREDFISSEMVEADINVDGCITSVDIESCRTQQPISSQENVTPIVSPTFYPTSMPTDPVTKWNIFNTSKYQVNFPSSWLLDEGKEQITKDNNSLRFNYGCGTDFGPDENVIREEFTLGGEKTGRFMFLDTNNKVEHIWVDETKGICISANIDTLSIDYTKNLAEIDQILSTFRFKQ